MQKSLYQSILITPIRIGFGDKHSIRQQKIECLPEAHLQVLL